MKAKRIFQINDDTVCLVNKDWLIRLIQEKKVLGSKLAEARWNLQQLKDKQEDSDFDEALEDSLREAVPSEQISQWSFEMDEEELKRAIENSPIPWDKHIPQPTPTSKAQPPEPVRNDGEMRDNELQQAIKVSLEPGKIGKPSKEGKAFIKKCKANHKLMEKLQKKTTMKTAPSASPKKKSKRTTKPSRGKRRSGSGSAKR